MHGETRKYEGMRRTNWYAAMTEDAAQRSRWTFYEVVKNSHQHYPIVPVPVFGQVYL
jgi:hypothetical protein